jgi:hypothetical protein
MKPVASALVLLGALALCAPGLAQPATDDAARVAARKLGYDGIEAYNAGDFALASERLEAAYATLAVPSLGLWSARALSKRGRLVEAAERYRIVSTLPVPDTNREVHEAALREAAEERAQLLPRIPLLTIEVHGHPQGGVVTLDGRALPDASLGAGLPVDPGPHHIELSARGRTVQRDVVLREGERMSVQLELYEVAAAPAPVAPPPPAPAPPPARPPPPGPAASSSSGLRIAGWIGLGLGGAGVLVGTIAGGVAVGQNGELDEVCVDDVCPPTAEEDVGDYDTTRTVSTLGFVVGAVGIAAGVVLLLVPSSDGGASVKARVGPGTGSVAISF